MSAPSVSTVRTLPALPNVLRIRADDSQPKYHPAFSLPDADVVLRSHQGTLYRVHGFTLRTTSAFFATMFSLPQPTSPVPTTDAPPDILDVYEHDAPLETLLRLMSGMPIARFSTLDAYEAVLRLTEKWDTPGPLSGLRAALTAPAWLAAHPLRVYALARHFGWGAEANCAAAHTLVLDLHKLAPADQAIADQMAARDLMALVRLHRRRRDMFRALLDSPERFAAGNSSPYHCNRCGVTALDNRPWRAFKHAMFLEMERRPLGDTLGVVLGGTADWPEATACWEARCAKTDCGGLNYDRVATLRQIRACVALLPLTVDSDS